MTLLVNEIHVRQNLSNSLLLLAADRRITVNGKFHSNRKKLFTIPHLNAGIGYFGLAQVNQNEYFSSWVPNFIRCNSDAQTLDDFANRLCDQLNCSVDKGILGRTASGFQICGYNSKGYPALWFVRNILHMEGHVYKGFETKYRANEHFLKRDALNLGFDGVEPNVSNSFCQYYVNGDIRPFHSIWFRLDEFMSEMFSHASFRRPRDANDLIVAAKWKMGVISSFYHQFAKAKIIGTPIDALVLVPKPAKG